MDEPSASHRFAERAFLAGYRQCAEEVKPLIDKLKADNERLRQSTELCLWDGTKWQTRYQIGSQVL